MMNSQQLCALSNLVQGQGHRLPAGQVLPLGSNGGELSVLSGRVWLTRAGVPDDVFIDAGQAVRVPASGEAMIEGWSEGQPARVTWQPRSARARAVDSVRAVARRLRHAEPATAAAASCTIGRP
ncbi:MAG: DUF2917 domain-containing protein [Caldimonas sp.]